MPSLVSLGRRALTLLQTARMRALPRGSPSQPQVHSLGIAATGLRSVSTRLLNSDMGTVAQCPPPLQQRLMEDGSAAAQS